MKKNQVRSEWMLRRLSASSILQLLTNLGWKRLKDGR